MSTTEFDIDNCDKVTVDLVLRENHATMTVVEDDIREDLAKIGITVNARWLSDDDFGTAQEQADYHILFGETWGAPYDPHSYASWIGQRYLSHNPSLLDAIEDVQTELEREEIQKKWKQILEDIHAEAVFYPLWGSRIPYVINRRLIGFQPGSEAFAYPLNSITVAEGSKDVKAVPGFSGAIFVSVGHMHPHNYRPNLLFAQDWVYEGLVGYGQDGEVFPRLATTWNTVIDPNGDGQISTFTLRENVTFHDGTDFNCSVAKLNFDHILEETVQDRHSWMLTPNNLKSWECNADGQFVITTKTTFYPLLQELSYVRPFNFASAATFKNGLDTDPTTENACIPGAFGASYTHIEESVTCAGLSGSIGTGPFKLVTLDQEEAADGTLTDNKVVFGRHEEYWGQKPDIETLELVRYETTDEVEVALKDGSIDMTLGTGPLTAEQIQDIKFYNSDQFDVRHSDVLQHSTLIMNPLKSPTDDVNVRRAIIHAINKNRFIQDEFGGLEQPVEQLFPLTAPYCDVDLTPKWTYDLQKAQLLQCPAVAELGSGSLSEGSAVGGDDDSLSGGAIAGISIACAAVVVLSMLVIRMVMKERAGTPMFAPTKTGEEA